MSTEGTLLALSVLQLLFCPTKLPLPSQHSNPNCLSHIQLFSVPIKHTPNIQNWAVGFADARFFFSPLGWRWTHLSDFCSIWVSFSAFSAAASGSYAFDRPTNVCQQNQCTWLTMEREEDMVLWRTHQPFSALILVDFHHFGQKFTEYTWIRAIYSHPLRVRTELCHIWSRKENRRIPLHLFIYEPVVFAAPKLRSFQKRKTSLMVFIVLVRTFQLCNNFFFLPKNVKVNTRHKRMTSVKATVKGLEWKAECNISWDSVRRRIVQISF